MRSGKKMIRDMSNAKKWCFIKDEERKLRALVEARLPATGTALPPTLSPSPPASPSSPVPELELLDNVGDLLEAMHVRVGRVGGVGDDQEGGFFEEHHLVKEEGGREEGRENGQRKW